jgi:TPR repeat protein
MDGSGSRIVKSAGAGFAGLVLLWVAALGGCQTGPDAGLSRPAAGVASPELVQLHREGRGGDLRAQVMLGAMYGSGAGGLPRDPARAYFWTRRAAEQGNGRSQYNLGVFYAEGQGTQRNLQQAVYWFRKAAHQGLAEAQLHMGLMRAKGWGLHRCPYAASSWYFRAGESYLARGDFRMARYAAVEINRLLPGYYLGTELEDEIFLFAP